MSNTLELIVEHIPVSDIPEQIIEYLVGDGCLDSIPSHVFDEIFRTVYTWSDNTYLDPQLRILHSFRDQPADTKSDYWPQERKNRWFKNGKLHREGGNPAVIYFHGYKEWWENGIKIDCSNCSNPQ